MKTVALYRPVRTPGFAGSIGKTLDDFDRYMESFFGESPLAPAGRSLSWPAVDIRETEEAYVLEAELPGYDEKSVEVHLDGGILSIESKKAEHSEKKEENYIIRERRSSSFNRSFKLPENADPGAISAAFSKGLLRLEIKKLPETKRRVIEIAKS
jgi:HSP20 family protein